MWMSSMTSCVQILLWYMRCSPAPSERDLALEGLEIVVVVELAAGHDLAPRAGVLEAVVLERLTQPEVVELVRLLEQRVDAERGDLAGDEDLAVVHRVARGAADVAAHHD